MRTYVAGFVYSEDGKYILLIKKNKPEWQLGKLNAIGGKIEIGESPIHAMRREIKEEAGLEIEDWTHKITLKNTDWIVYFFSTKINTSDLLQCSKEIDEGQISSYVTDDIPHNVLYNLKWMIPLCKDDEIKFPLIITDKSFFKN